MSIDVNGIIKIDPEKKFYLNFCRIFIPEITS